MYSTKLQRLQNKILRIISKARTRDSISQQHYKFKVLKIDNLFTFEIAKIMHQSYVKKHRIILMHIFFTLRKFHPVSLAKLPAITFFLPRFRNLQRQRSLKYIGPKIWNDISLKIKNSSFLKFKELFKKNLTEKYKRA